MTDSMDLKLIPWEAIETHGVFMMMNGRANLERWIKTSDHTARRVHDGETTAFQMPEVCNFWSVPVEPKQKEIWEGHVDDEVAYASMAHHKISNISVAAYLLDRHDLYDDEIRAKLTEAYYG